MSTIEDPGSNPYLPPIQALFSSQSPSKDDIDAVAAQLITHIATARRHADRLWELWGAFFSGVVSSKSPAICIALLEAIRAHPPIKPTIPPSMKLRKSTFDTMLYWSDLPSFGMTWRAEFESLSHQRDWDGIGKDGVRCMSNSGSERYLNFVKFSAGLLKSEGDGVIGGVWAFILPRDVLERENPEARKPEEHHMSTEQLWALDVKLAAIWIRDGAQAVWNMDWSEEGHLQKYWGAALAEATELWPRTDGLTRERWGLWATRLRAWSLEDDKLDEETRVLVTEAAEVVEGLLGAEFGATGTAATP